MKKEEKTIIMDSACGYVRAGWHCSEGVLLAAGKHFSKEVNESVLRASTPFAGGVGGSTQDTCGALNGGIMAIGLIYGRTDANTNDDKCMKLAEEYRRRFLEYFGSTVCFKLKENWVGKPGQEDCAELSGQAAGILAEVLESNQ